MAIWVAGGGPQPVDRVEYVGDVLEQVPSGVTDFGPGPVPVQECDAELALQFADGFAQRGLGDVQTFAGATQRSVLADGDEVLELFDSHGLS